MSLGRGGSRRAAAAVTCIACAASALLGCPGEIAGMAVDGGDEDARGLDATAEGRSDGEARTSDGSLESGRDATAEGDAGGTHPSEDAVAPTDGGSVDDAPDDADGPGDDGGPDAQLLGDTRCDDGGYLEICFSEAYGTCSWSREAHCAFGCENGQCLGPCAPGATRCSPGSATDLETCGDAGAWSAPAPCPGQACFQGACAGSCVPGAVTCTGGATRGDVQQCRVDGTWGPFQTCDRNSQICRAGACVANTPYPVGAGQGGASWGPFAASPNTVYLVPVVAATTAYASDFHVFSNTAGAALYSLYADNGGKPSLLLASVYGDLAVGDNTAALAVGRVIQAGTTYWVGVVVESDFADAGVLLRAEASPGARLAETPGDYVSPSPKQIDAGDVTVLPGVQLALYLDVVDPP